MVSAMQTVWLHKEPRTEQPYKTAIWTLGGQKMANEKLIKQICTIQRGLGIIEGVASGLANEAVSQLLYTAAEMIDEAVVEITKDGK